MSDQQPTIQQGEHGLVYLTVPDENGVFIAAANAKLALEILPIARRCLKTGMQSVPLHVVHQHTNSSRVTVPSPDWMTSAQRNETVKRLREHLATRILS